MPILFQISVEVNSGSVGRIAEHIGQIAISNGWESYIAYARNCLPSSSKTIKIGNKIDIYWHGINTRLFDNHCLCSTNPTKKLIKQIEKIKPDIIHLHHIHGYYLNMKILFDFLSKLDIPIVWVFHDCWSFTGHCAYFDFVGCDKWITGCYSCLQKDKYPASKLFDRSRKNYKIKKQLFTNIKNMTIVPVSYWLGGLVKQSFFSNYPIQVIHNGIDINIFHPVIDTEAIMEKYKIDKKFILLGVATSWDERKRLKDFIALNSIIDHESFKIVLVGLNKKQIRSLPDEIIGIERTEDVKELAILYSAADIHISCSVEETFGLTIAESMACGTPVVVYNCTALPELVNSDTGFVVEKKNIEGIYKAIKNIKEKGKDYYITACRNRALNFFNKDERYKDYFSLYNKLLELDIR